MLVGLGTAKAAARFAETLGDAQVEVVADPDRLSYVAMGWEKQVERDAFCFCLL